MTTTPVGHPTSFSFFKRFLCVVRRIKTKVSSSSLLLDQSTEPTGPASPLIAMAPHLRSPPSVRRASPISRIPVELLTQIFTHVPRVEFEESLQFKARIAPSGPMWMAIAQVCHHWRMIVADCREFWSYIPLQSSLYWVEVSLARSHPHPISFSVDLSATQPEWYQRAALSALHVISRAREVYIHTSAVANSGLHMAALRILDDAAAPKLEVLGIHGTVACEPVPFSGSIFRHHTAAALHTLTLAFCEVHPSSPLFQAPLVSLRLENCRVEFPLGVLSLLPHLRTLVLAGIHGTFLSYSSDVVRLLHLRHLELTSPSSDIAFLLRNISIPPSTSLSITCVDYIVSDDPLDDLTLLHKITLILSPVLATYLERAFAEGYSLPLLEITTPTNASKRNISLLDPTSTSTSTSTSSTGTPTSPQLNLSLVWADSSTDLFFQMLSALPIAALQRIHTLGMREEDPSCTAAKEARSRSSPAQPRRPLPLPLAGFHKKARDEAVMGLLTLVMQQGLLPALREVSFQGIDFKNLDVDLVARVLVHRQRAMTGGSITLSLRDCIVSDGTIGAFQDCLGLDAVRLGV
ncbi:hypothetical protein B0F90DRAFT_1927383 [Multifurca ochricompacta]|uniref:F-box domain-containing protein n=1 Tax=Multifurca ochricompacta TaxID=376703 RepID=A0AAD4M1E3_9AGAM|nr:hypothetical protein B0F90DRAFT_1927383 [Multifurca ochricompacta]